LTLVNTGDAVVPASQFAGLEKQVRELQTLVGITGRFFHQ